MGLPDNLQDLTVLLQAMKGDHLSRKDFTRAFAALKNAILDARKRLNEEVRKALDSALTEIRDIRDTLVRDAEKRFGDMEQKYEKRLKAVYEEMKSDARTTSRMHEIAISDTRDMIPERYDDMELRRAIDGINQSLKKLPAEFDPTKLVTSIDQLAREVDDLKKRPLAPGGGVTNARIAQAFKYILKTEEPTGDIDGVNTAYTVAQPIFAVVAFSLNGESIAELPNYTIAGRTITFSSALPAAYSGKDFEVKYIAA